MKPLILTVDDERQITDLIRLCLEEAGYEVACASSSREALDVIRDRRPNLILLDLMLPDVDGLSFFEILRSGRSTATIPVAILTGWSTDEARKYGAELGAVAYLNKPLTRDVLLEHVGQILGPRPRAKAKRAAK